MPKRLMLLAATALSMTMVTAPIIHAQSASLTGQWKVVRDDKPGTTLLVFTQSGELFTGKWVPAKGAASDLENGKIEGDTLTLSFVHDKARFNASGHLSADSMELEITQRKKNGKGEMIHARATRESMP